MTRAPIIAPSAARAAARIASLHGRATIAPVIPEPGARLRGVFWEARPNPFPAALAQLEATRAAVRELEGRGELGAAFVHVEGLVRAGHEGDRGARKETCVLVLVVANDEPSLVVLLPTET